MQHGSNAQTCSACQIASSAISAPDQIPYWSRSCGIFDHRWHTDPIAELKEHLSDSSPNHGEAVVADRGLATARHAVTTPPITLRPFRVTVAQLPRHNQTQTISPPKLCLPLTRHYNLTRKAARAALASPSALSALSHAPDALSLHRRCLPCPALGSAVATIKFRRHWPPLQFRQRLPALPAERFFASSLFFLISPP